MNFNILSAFRGAWSIEPKFTAAFALGVFAILKSGKLELLKQEDSQPEIYSINSELSSKHPDSKVSIIPMKGPLFKESDSDFGIVGDKERGQWLKNSYKDDSIQAIILYTETPGGTVDGTEEFVEILNQRNKPVIQFFEGISCSKGVWIGANCDLIIASTDHAETGSIGVMFGMTDLLPILEKWGAKSHHVTADQSKDKNKSFYDFLEGNYKAIKEEALNPLADAFIKTVKTNRPNVKAEQLTGKVYFAKDVIGTLVDSIGNFEYAIEQALSLVKPDIKTIKI